MRRAVEKLAVDLEDVRVLLGASVSGIAYVALDRLGFRLCEMDGFSPECLDALKDALEGPAEGKAAAPDRPQETGLPGVYSLDLGKALEAWPDLSSKRILRPFLQGVEFSRLELFCGHVPPWLPPELERLGLDCARKSPTASREGIMLHIFPRERDRR